MKRRELDEMWKKDVDELRRLVDELRTELMGLRFSHATGALENTSRLRETRRDIARLLTIINAKQKSEQPAVRQPDAAAETEVTA